MAKSYSAEYEHGLNRPGFSGGRLPNSARSSLPPRTGAPPPPAPARIDRCQHAAAQSFDHEDEIVAAGQTIVYCLHQSIGHLGIFVSGKVATKEHGEFAQAMDLIDVMPPGLYEAVISGIDETMNHRELVRGDYLFTLEARTLDAIRGLGGNSSEDELRFAAAARVSEINKGLYRNFAAPAVGMMASEQSAAALRDMHPNRLRFQMFADSNPLMTPVASWAEQVRANRRPVGADNPFLAVERMMSDWIAGGLEAWGKARDSVMEDVFLNLYGAPWLQAMIGLAGDDPQMRGRRIARDLAREAVAKQMAAHLEQRIETGGLCEAAIRALLYVRMPDGVADERGFAALQQIASELPAAKRMSLSRFKEIVRDQFLILRLDEERAITVLPKLLPADRRARETALGMLHRIVEARGAPSAEGALRMTRIAALFGGAPPAKPGMTPQIDEAAG